MIVHDKNGGRTVQLFIPFDYKGKKIEAITFAPMRFGHTMRWAEGAWSASFGLLVELAGVEEGVIRELRYPDADRVMEAFLSMMPPDVRSDISEGRIPQKREEARQEAPPQQAMTNGSGEPVMPGAPMPPQFDTQPGFDISDEREQP